MQYLTPERTTLTYELPLAEVVTDFFDEMKSRSKGYASMEYQFLEHRQDDLVRLDVKINGELAEPLACICHRCAGFVFSLFFCFFSCGGAEGRGRRIVVARTARMCLPHLRAVTKCRLEGAAPVLRVCMGRCRRRGCAPWVPWPVRMSAGQTGACGCRDKAYHVGKALVTRLKEVIPRQQFKVPIQATIGQKSIASVALSAMRKDVLAKCYGGDVSRKKKLLSKQAEGKKRMKSIGRVEVPQEAFMAVLKVNRED